MKKKHRGFIGVAFAIMALLFGGKGIGNDFLPYSVLDDNSNKKESVVNTANEVREVITEVEYVVDGDTFICRIDGERKTVRMIGVDTPESVSVDESKNCEEGKIASDFTKEHLEKQRVKLLYDVSEKDKYGRELCYVWVVNSDGKCDEKMYQIVLLENGMAKSMLIEPNTKYGEVFLEAERKAKENKVGFWNEYFIH